MNKSQQNLTDNQFIKKVDLSICNGDFNLDSWLNTDGSNLLNNLRRTVQVNETLVDPHLKTIPSLRTFTTRCFSCSDSQSLGRHPNRSFHFEVLFLCTSYQVSAYYREIKASQFVQNRVILINLNCCWLRIAYKTITRFNSHYLLIANYDNQSVGHSYFAFLIYKQSVNFKSIF